MEMTDLAIWLSWAGVAVVIAGVGLYLLVKRGKLRWLGRIKMPRVFGSKAGTQLERLLEQTENERTRAEELRRVLDAKTELAKVKADNTRLLREIGRVSEKSVKKAEREAEKEAERRMREAEEAQKAKPRRL